MRIGTMRYSVTNTRGQRDGKTWGVFDRYENKVVQWHKTLKGAMTSVRKWNRKGE